MEDRSCTGSAFHGDMGCSKEMHKGSRFQERHMKTSSNFHPWSRRYIGSFKAIEVRTFPSLPS